jgi:hypothetical protein
LLPTKSILPSSYDTMTYDLLGRRWYLRASWNLQ